jgi:hypothetical protein
LSLFLVPVSGWWCCRFHPRMIHRLPSWSLAVLIYIHLISWPTLKSQNTDLWPDRDHGSRSIVTSHLIQKITHCEPNLETLAVLCFPLYIPQSRFLNECETSTLIHWSVKIILNRKCQLCKPQRIPFHLQNHSILKKHSPTQVTKCSCRSIKRFGWGYIETVEKYSHLSIIWIQLSVCRAC